eukprot:jgi/Picsp_1/6715/NSC_04057-R1_---NA---
MLGLAGEVQASADPRISIALVLGDLEREDAIVHKIYKFAREVLRMDIRLKERQFLSVGFQRNKIDFMVEFARSIKKFHQLESKKAKRGHTASALHRVGSFPEPTILPHERFSNKHSEPQDRVEEVHPRPIPPFVQARCLQNFSCTESDQKAPAGASTESTAVWFPSGAAFKSQEDDVVTNRHRAISEDFSYLHDVYGNLETTWLGALPLTLDESETTWLTNPDESLVVCGKGPKLPVIPCPGDSEYGLPLVNPLYSDIHPENRNQNKSFCSREINSRKDQDLNSLLESLEVRMDQASNVLQDANNLYL